MTETKEVDVKQEESQSWEDVLENERSYAPFVDIYETNDEFVLVANMPGVSKENVGLKTEEDSLVIFGKVNFEDKLNRKYILNENEIGHYYRRFRISDSIDVSKINAKMENGQLTISLPKHDRIKPRTIKIQ